MIEVSLTTGGAAALGLLVLALSAAVSLLERAVAAREAPPGPSDEPWGQRWPRYRNLPRRGPRVVKA